MKILFILLTLIYTLSIQKVNAQDWAMRTVQFSSTGVDTEEYSTVLDFDGDGFKDLLFGNAHRRELFLLRNHESAAMQLEQLTDTLFGTLGLHGCNYNNDEFDDFVIAATTSNGDELWLWVNLGNDQFERIYMGYAPYEGIKKMIANDFDQDGDMDLVYDDWANSNVIWTMVNNGDNTFEQNFIEYTGQPTGLFGEADLDSDGDLDLVTTYFNFSSNTYVLSIQENMGGMQFLNHEGPSLAGTYSGILGDFVGDELIDLMVSSTANNGAIYQNNGNLEFVLSAVNPNLATYALLGPVEDWDNNGFDDYYAVEGQEMKRKTQNTNGTFATSVLASDASGAILYMEDFDHDGVKDIMNAYRELWLASGSVFIKTYSSYLHASNRLALLDTDGEGNLDIVCGGSAGQCTLFNQTFDEEMAYPEDVYLTGTDISFSSTVRDILSYDKDGDGDMDLLCLVATYLYWLENENGTFTQELIANNVNGYAPWIGDLDHDGNHDILLHDSPFKRWESNGNSYTSSTISWSVSDAYGVLDVDHDTDLDILFFYWNIEAQVWELRYLKNNNNNFVDTYLLTITDNFPIPFNLLGSVQCSVRDLDLDGDEDLIFASGEINFTDNTDFIGWLRHDGPENLVPLLITDEVGQFKSFDTGDFDMDGDVDVISSVGVDYGLMMHRNDGEENFVVEQLPFQVSAPLRVLARDMDNDLDPDIAFASAIDRRVGWLVNGAISCDRSYSSEQATLCEGDSLWFGERWISNPGIYGDTLVSENGCDSVHVGYVSVLQFPVVGIIRDVNDLSVNQDFVAYTWLLNGVVVSSSMSIDVAEFGVGSYSFIGTTTEGCTLEGAPLEVVQIVSVLERATNSWIVAPNPIKDHCVVRNTAGGQIKVMIFDALGCCVISIAGYNGFVELEMSELATGIYVAKCQDANGKIEMIKLEKLN
jgi:hypothetical protein